jgi:hypothetical protein
MIIKSIKTPSNISIDEYNNIYEERSDWIGEKYPKQYVICALMRDYSISRITLADLQIADTPTRYRSRYTPGASVCVRVRVRVCMDVCNPTNIKMSRSAAIAVAVINRATRYAKRTRSIVA